MRLVGRAVGGAALPKRFIAAQRLYTRRTYSMYKHMCERAKKDGATVPFALAVLRDRFSEQLGVERPGVFSSCCGYCGEPLKVRTFSLDHSTPIERGGTWELNNLDAICDRCNRAKGTMTDREFGSLMNLISRWPTSVRNDVLGRLKAGAALRRLRFAKRTAA